MNYLMYLRKIQYCAGMPHFPVFQGDDRDLSNKHPLNTIKHTFTVYPEVCLERFMVTTRPMFLSRCLGIFKKKTYPQATGIDKAQNAVPGNILFFDYKCVAVDPLFQDHFGHCLESMF